MNDHSYISKNPKESLILSLENSNNIFSDFAEYLNRFQNFNVTKLENLDKYWSVRTIQKNDYLYKNDIAFNEFCIIKGAVKISTVFNEKEVVTDLLTEGCFGKSKNDSIMEHGAIYEAKCMEPTIVVTISNRNISKLTGQYPVFSRIFLKQRDRAIKNLQDRLFSNTALSAKERYDNLLNHSPELINRFSLKDIASYLGIKAETISRVRRRSFKKAS